MLMDMYLCLWTTRQSSSGGGMGGLFLGLCLKQYARDVEFDIYEAATELAEVGAGAGMSPRGI